MARTKKTGSTTSSEHISPKLSLQKAAAKTSKPLPKSTTTTATTLYLSPTRSESWKRIEKLQAPDGEEVCITNLESKMIEAQRYLKMMTKDELRGLHQLCMYLTRDKRSPKDKEYERRIAEAKHKPTRDEAMSVLRMIAVQTMARFITKDDQPDERTGFCLDCEFCDRYNINCIHLLRVKANCP